MSLFHRHNWTIVRIECDHHRNTHVRISDLKEITRYTGYPEEVHDIPFGGQTHWQDRTYEQCTSCPKRREGIIEYKINTPDPVGDWIKNGTLPKG